MRKNLPETITILLLLSIMTIGIIRRRSNGFNMDVRIRDFLFNKTSSSFKKGMETVTNLANVDTIWVITLPILFYLIAEQMYVTASAIILSIFMAVFASQGLKILFRIHRPETAKEFYDLGYSFPSGHATVGMSYYLTLGFVLSDMTGGNSLIVFVMGFLAVLIGVSRLVLGVHWFTDVVIGLFLGAICCYWVIFLFSTGYYIKLIF
ncbi:phosphatase PAP2 family protein [Lagierella sp.]|uniref:phosphatase PAP2 family protein n=1 Tax=Lagierella sp. TaxID=2849657 RepID=UPI00260AECBC|nr:phosphatase PAP2 family protein [Lagierella sp.]